MWEKRAAFERIRLQRGVSGADLRTTVLGMPVRMPILVAPPACTPSPTPKVNGPPPAAPERRGR